MTDALPEATEAAVKPSEHADKASPGAGSRKGLTGGPPTIPKLLSPLWDPQKSRGFEHRERQK